MPQRKYSFIPTFGKVFEDCGNTFRTAVSVVELETFRVYQ